MCFGVFIVVVVAGLLAACRCGYVSRVQAGFELELAGGLKVAATRCKAAAVCDSPQLLCCGERAFYVVVVGRWVETTLNL